MKNVIKFPAIPRILSCVALAGMACEASTIDEDFKNPPVAVRPYVWWHWMGPNISKEGITKDLEAMKDAGIGGATIFHITPAVTVGAKPTAVAMLSCIPAASAAGLARPRCEYLGNPLGIDVPKPRLSWMIPDLKSEI